MFQNVPKVTTCSVYQVMPSVDQTQVCSPPETLRNKLAPMIQSGQILPHMIQNNKKLVPAITETNTIAVTITSQNCGCSSGSPNATIQPQTSKSPLRCRSGRPVVIIPRAKYGRSCGSVANGDRRQFARNSKLRSLVSGQNLRPMVASAVCGTIAGRSCKREGWEVIGGCG